MVPPLLALSRQRAILAANRIIDLAREIAYAKLACTNHNGPFMTSDALLTDAKSRRQAIAAFLFEQPSSDYDTALVQLQAANRLFREELAERLEPALNTFVKNASPESLHQRREIARRVNAELATLGLSLYSDRTHSEAYLKANTADNATGRYQLMSMRKTGDWRAAESSVSHIPLRLTPRTHFGYGTYERGRGTDHKAGL